MTPLDHFNSIWSRCEELAAMHAYLARQLTVALRPDELLRAEWVTRVSALDLYVHELVTQKMLETFEGHRLPSNGYLRFQVANDTLMRIRAAPTPYDARQAFDLELRTRLGYSTFQDPDKIADGIRLCSDVELWNEVALRQGATQATKIAAAKGLKRELSLIVERRNKIAHEGDLQPIAPRVPWTIDRADVQRVASCIKGIVHAIDQIVQ
ncbi:conserved hypothetical protein [Paraburkholderia tropica]|uniref:HEPN domain-containing protein n=1 Tax=Paraburkholderia tropica TaxID=92647 RepID=UPI001CB244B4|nr:HEPN domain-containing protein [Paraburkholderia tropica]CAG9215620.1 conserved hypothetical protein [Paraburkholderia tropica]